MEIRCGYCGAAPHKLEKDKVCGRCASRRSAPAPLLSVHLLPFLEGDLNYDVKDTLVGREITAGDNIQVLGTDFRVLHAFPQHGVVQLHTQFYFDKPVSALQPLKSAKIVVLKDSMEQNVSLIDIRDVLIGV